MQIAQSGWQGATAKQLGSVLGPLEGVRTPCQQGDSTQKPPHTQTFGEVLGRKSSPHWGLSTVRCTGERWEAQGQSSSPQPDASNLFLCMNKIQRCVSGITPLKVRGEITCHRVQPTVRFVKEERRWDLPQILSTYILHLETAEGKKITYK